MSTVRMSDVARAAGVSTMTVSNVVNDRPGVSAEVRRRVLRQLADSGYRMNVSARNLRSGHSGVIGLAVPGHDVPYFGSLAMHIAREADQRGYRVAVEQTGAQEAGEVAAIQFSRAMDYDGLILSIVGMDLEKLEVAPTFPIVLLGERENPTAADHVSMANREGSRAAVEHLREQGARRIAFIGGPDTPDQTIHSLRLGGYRSALEQAGLGVDPALLFDASEVTMESGRRAGHRLAREIRSARQEGRPAPDAAFAITDTVAFGALRGLADHGLTVPEDLLLVGFDDIPEAAFMVPALSSVAPDLAWTARRAVELLLERIGASGRPGGAESRQVREETIPWSLEVRESSTPVRSQQGSVPVPGAEHTEGSAMAEQDAFLVAQTPPSSSTSTGDAS
ncbi:LacI family DNA-binding transcriptional regulator [Nesterenkonia sp. HG001]|uniref:LacI family DNA-binding transcriptional regulator n=1 Tax=Nesterenkonia sp. HG001 TaxID=2983207 RepID=UPI002AC45878|nr:LacI family DNA-binding transcriptional regulator [Nesterenkonia sp. HG001]MDZ5076004.1 LacI family transcriptional regulator [Nesterenkonia sp. HG001]